MEAVRFVVKVRTQRRQQKQDWQLFVFLPPPPSALGVRVYEREESRKADRCREVRNTEVATFAKDDDVL